MVFVNRSVEKCREDWCEEGVEVFDHGWFDIIDVTGFVWVDVVYGFGDLVFCDMIELEGWVVCFVVLDVVVLVVWYGFGCFLADCDVVVVEGVGNVGWVGVGFVFVC